MSDLFPFFFHSLPLSFFKTEKRSFSTLLYLTCRYFLLVEGEKIEKKKIKKRPLSFCFRLCFVLIRIRNPLCLIERIRKASNSKAHTKKERTFKLQEKTAMEGGLFFFLSDSQNGDKRNASLISYGLTCNVHGIAPSYWLDVATRKIRRPMSPQPPNA